MKNPPTSQDLQDAQNGAVAADDRTGPTILAPGQSTAYAVSLAKPLPAGLEATLAGQMPTPAIAFEAHPPSKDFYEALEKLETLHAQNRVVVGMVVENIPAVAQAEHESETHIATEALLGGNTQPMDELESLSDKLKRLTVRNDTLAEASRKLAHAGIQPAIVVAKGIDSALGKLAADLESRDAEECKKFGIATQYSGAARLVQSIRLQFSRRSHDLRRFAAMNPGDPLHVFAHRMFREFLDLSA